MDRLGGDLPDFLSIVVPRREVESGDVSGILAALTKLLEAPALARRYVERVQIAFHGYEDTTAELFEIDQVRDFVHQLDGEFPYWLFFLTKHTTSLQAITLCMLPPFLTPKAKAEAFPGLVNDLLLKRWFPAMNEIAEFAGLREQELAGLTDRSVDYIQRGPLPTT